MDFEQNQISFTHQLSVTLDSVNSNNSFNGKDREDGLIIAKEKVGESSIQYLNFAYSYTRKGGKCYVL